MYILGISAYYHDSAAALLLNGQVIFAAEEERFSRIKHDNNFPLQAIEASLKYAGITIDQVDVIAYYEKPLLKFERILEHFVQNYPLGVRYFVRGMFDWLSVKIKVQATIRKVGFRGDIFYIPHHLSHASAGYYPSPFKSAAILTIDGIGEYQTTALWSAKENHIDSLGSLKFPHSLGLLYSVFTAFLGFRVNEDEYKVMGLAAYGKPVFAGEIYKLLDVKEDGSFALDMRYFSFGESTQSWTASFEDLFGLPRKEGAEITERDKNLAASIQVVTEEIYFKILNFLFSLTNTSNLCIGGGVALNVLANGKILARTPFKDVYILGAAGDSGAALGAGLFAFHNLLNLGQRTELDNLSFGLSYDEEFIESELKRFPVAYEKITNEDDLLERTARLLIDQKVLGWFQGRSEFGPRALGSRSILADPRKPAMKEQVNKTKGRELFRPFGLSMLGTEVEKYYYKTHPHTQSPFMTFCFSARPEAYRLFGAVIHEDGTTRIQTVDQSNGRYFKLLEKFRNVSGCPGVLNTSFNLKGEPLVETPLQAIEDFLKTDLDYLVIGNFLVKKIINSR